MLFRYPILASACVAAAAFIGVASSPAADSLGLVNDAVRLNWRPSPEGWRLAEATVATAHGPRAIGEPLGEYTVLFSREKPSTEPAPFSSPSWPDGYPDPVFKHTTRCWRDALSPVSLNTAGESTSFFPAIAERQANGGLRFRRQTDVAEVEADWNLDPAQPGDVTVVLTLTARQAGYFSLASPTLATIPATQLAWAMVPGVFAGTQIEPDLALAFGYGQGIPNRPVLARERTASTLLALVTTKEGISSGVIAEPGTATDPWAKNRDTRPEWRLGLSVMNRAAKYAPTLWHPVLGEVGSRLAVGESCVFRFRYTLRNGDWFQVVNHAAYDVYRLEDFLALRHAPHSLSSRLERLHRFLADDEVSHWRTEEFQGRTLGAQFYGTGQRSGVVGSDGDAIKNSDYGAMWMLARLTNDPRLVRDRLPYARAFKLAQQQAEPGFFQGSAVGQYYLYKSKRFVEEWGNYVEPIAITFYTLSDLGNLLLFDPQDQEARERLRVGAEKLLSWQHPDGHWEVAYDRTTERATFTDLRDYRPTFYGLLIAWRVLGDEKYLQAARKGADWLVEHAVTPQRYLGVCGDARFAPDFATAQVAQALLDLGEATGEAKYRDAGIAVTRFYATSVYTHPLATKAAKQAGGQPHEDWEINQTGLGFEHGGTLGSAVPNGPILLASHAGLFLRVYALTGDTLLRDLARAGALARDAFVEPKTGVASYYWNKMNAGSGSFPHHAWWQIGWITDYLLSEAQVRSEGAVVFPRGFFTPKVGPHASYGFAPGKVYGVPAVLAWQPEEYPQSEIDSFCARSVDGTRNFTVLLNSSPRAIRATIPAKAASATLVSGKDVRSPLASANGTWTVPLEPWGLAVIETVSTSKPTP